MFTLQTADDVLRRADWTARSDGNGARGRSAHSLIRLLSCIVTFAFLYGAVMGSFRGLAGLPSWEWQMLFSATKVPLLLTGSFFITLPTFFVLSTLLGLRQDFTATVRALFAAQAGLAITLAALAPLTMLCYASTSNYSQALALNGLMFAVASLAGQMLLRVHYRPLIARNPRHRQMLLAWGTAYAFVAIQLAWLLRPFLGTKGLEVQFLRTDVWDNAYVVVVRLIWRAVFG
ncbi:hypothetical protein [Adhaeretor mobilis]|uniref:Actin-binding WH2 domain-containing protein n=1 Tax=Adhaeretor mobilis TaxID=1930276 RepID=A0A517MQ68_9BACT|nr:hypothetical protein [Adhaeretor mobilis]QDS97012.1 hypothetical protein HG15A2_02710 [Adhaeretor mobilis]